MKPCLTNTAHRSILVFIPQASAHRYDQFGAYGDGGVPATPIYEIFRDIDPEKAHAYGSCPPAQVHGNRSVRTAVCTSLAWCDALQSFPSEVLPSSSFVLKTCRHGLVTRIYLCFR